MKVFSRISLAVLAGALITVSHGAAAQRRSDDVRRSPVPADDRRWDRDNDRRDRDDDRRYDRDANRRRERADDRWRYDDNRRRNRISDAELVRRQRLQHIEWCRRHRNDRRCAELYRQGNNWCWDRNHDNRCDYADYRRRDSRGVMRTDRGPEWERWLRSSGVNVEALLNQPR